MADGARFVLPYQVVIDSSGVPRAGAKLYFYESGNDTPLNTYSNVGLTVPNTNPVIADAGGQFGNIFLLPQPYKVVLKTSADQEVWTADPVSSLGSGGGTNILYGFPTTADLLAAFSGGTTLTNGTGAQTSGRTDPADGGGGLFRYDATDISSPDNAGTIRVDAQNRRWKYIGDSIVPQLFGTIAANQDHTAVFNLFWAVAWPKHLIPSAPANGYQLAGSVMTAGQDYNVECEKGATFLQTANQPCVSLANGWQWTETCTLGTATVTPTNGLAGLVAVVTMAANHQVAPGDVVKIVSDDQLPFGRISTRCGETAVVLLPTSGNQVTLTGPLLLAASYATNIRISLFKTNKFNWSGPLLASASNAVGAINGVLPLFAFTSLRGPRWDGGEFGPAYSVAVQFQSCYDVRASRMTGTYLLNNPSLNQYGYTVGFPSCQMVTAKEISGRNNREVVDAGSGLHGTNVDPSLYGPTISANFVDMVCHGGAHGGAEGHPEQMYTVLRNSRQVANYIGPSALYALGADGIAPIIDGNVISLCQCGIGVTSPQDARITNNWLNVTGRAYSIGPNTNTPTKTLKGAVVSGNTINFLGGGASGNPGQPVVLNATAALSEAYGTIGNESWKFTGAEFTQAVVLVGDVCQWEQTGDINIDISGFTGSGFTLFITGGNNTGAGVGSGDFFDGREFWINIKAGNYAGGVTLCASGANPTNSVGKMKFNVRWENDSHTVGALTDTHCPNADIALVEYIGTAAPVARGFGIPGVIRARAYAGLEPKFPEADFTFGAVTLAAQVPTADPSESGGNIAATSFLLAGQAVPAGDITNGKYTRILCTTGADVKGVTPVSSMDTGGDQVIFRAVNGTQTDRDMTGVKYTIVILP